MADDYSYTILAFSKDKYYLHHSFEHGKRMERFNRIANKIGIDNYPEPQIDPRYIEAAFDYNSSPIGLTHQQVEFIGDLVLNLVVQRMTLSRGIYDWWTLSPELVGNESLNNLINDHDLEKEIIGQPPIGRRTKRSANVFEALVGYIYLATNNLDAIQHWLEEYWNFASTIERFSRKKPISIPLLPEPIIADSTSNGWDWIPPEYAQWTVELGQDPQRVTRSTQSELMQTLIESKIWNNSSEASLAYQNYGQAIIQLALAETLLLYQQQGANVRPMTMRRLSKLLSEDGLRRIIQNTDIGQYYRNPVRTLSTIVGIIDWLLHFRSPVMIPNTNPIADGYFQIRDWLQEAYFDPDAIDRI